MGWERRDQRDQSSPTNLADDDPSRKQMNGTTTAAKTGKKFVFLSKIQSVKLPLLSLCPSPSSLP